MPSLEQLLARLFVREVEVGLVGSERYSKIQERCIQGLKWSIIHSNGAILEFTRLILGFALWIQVFMKFMQFLITFSVRIPFSCR
jgi:hypothetical protein